MAASAARHVRVTEQEFAACYALLAETFHADVLDDAATLLEQLRAPRDSQELIMLARLADQETARQPAGLVVGFRLSLDGLVIGFIEYLVTRPECCGQGCAGELLDAFEGELARCAAARGERLALALGEVEPELLRFKARHGYQTPLAGRYVQPPLRYNPHSGQPLSPEVPLLLMVKSWVGPLQASQLLTALEIIFERCYLPAQASPAVRQAARRYILQNVFQPFQDSLTLADGLVVMDPGPADLSI